MHHLCARPVSIDFELGLLCGRHLLGHDRERVPAVFGGQFVFYPIHQLDVDMGQVSVFLQLGVYPEEFVLFREARE